MSEDTKNPFGAGFEEAKGGSFIKWEKIGQTVKGVLLETYEADNFNKDGKQKVYILEQEDGTKINVGSRGEGFDRAMAGVVYGQMVGLFYAEDLKTEKGQPFKLVKVFPGQIITKTDKVIAEM